MKIEWDHKGPSSEYEGTKWLGERKNPGQVNETIYLRKHFQAEGGYFSQVLVTINNILSGEPEVVLSMNGRTAMSLGEMDDMRAAIIEAKMKLLVDARVSINKGEF